MKKSSRFMTSTEKKIANKNAVIRVLLVLLMISITLNIISGKYIISNNKKVDDTSDGIIEKVVSTEDEDVITDEKNNNDIAKEDDTQTVIVDDAVDNSLNGKDTTEENKLVDKSEIYDLLYKEIIAGKTSVHFSFDKMTMTYEDVYNEYEKILDEHPEIFWLSGGASSSGTLYNSEVSYTIEFMTSCDMANVESMSDELEYEVSKIILGAKNYESEYDQIKYVHDYLVTECDYDMESFNKMNEEGNDAVDNIIYTSYGCLINKKSVCAGYARAFQLLMNRLGIECGTISGVGVNSMVSGPHAWNYVYTDGKYYYVDVTWDDPVYDEGQQKPEEICYDYFCISLDEISKDHFADEGEYLPQ